MTPKSRLFRLRFQSSIEQETNQDVAPWFYRWINHGTRGELGRLPPKKDIGKTKADTGQ